MATKAVIALLATAKGLSETVNDAELQDGIEALEFLGDEADGKSQEYKDLKDVVERIEATLADKVGKSTSKDPAQKAERLNYMGIKQIGSLWYSAKDKYSKPFSTADECAEHFNSKE